MPIRIAKSNAYVSEGSPSRRILIAKVGAYVSEGSPPGIHLSKANAYIAELVDGEPPRRRRRWQAFIP